MSLGNVKKLPEAGIGLVYRGFNQPQTLLDQAQWGHALGVAAAAVDVERQQGHQHLTRPATAPLGGGSTARTAAVTDVVDAANAFLATLSTTQQATVLQTFSAANVVKWSNFPIAGYNRHIGIQFDALTTAQRTAALAVIQAATGTAANKSFDEIQQIRAADNWLVDNGSSSATFSSNYYLLPFWGSPVPPAPGCCSAAATTRPPTLPSAQTT